MPDSERIERALGATREGCQTLELLDGVQAFATTGKHFVRISLMTHIPDESVVRGLVNVM